MGAFFPDSVQKETWAGRLETPKDLYVWALRCSVAFAQDVGLGKRYFSHDPARPIRSSMQATLWALLTKAKCHHAHFYREITKVSIRSCPVLPEERTVSRWFEPGTLWFAPLVVAFPTWKPLFRLEGSTQLFQVPFWHSMHTFKAWFLWTAFSKIVAKKVHTLLSRVWKPALFAVSFQSLKRREINPHQPHS